MSERESDTTRKRPPQGDAPAEPEPIRNRATVRSAGAWATLLLVAVLGVGVDLVSKSLAFRTVAGDPVVVSREDVLESGPAGIRGLIPPHEPVTVAPYLLEFRLVLNPGAVFGIGPGKRWFFVAFTVGAIVMALFAFARWTRPSDRWAHAALGLVLAGGLGNLYDRLAFGCVRDFLHPLPNVHLPFGLAWPSGAREVWPWVSNVADALLLIGIAILIVHMWRFDPDGEVRADAAAPPKSD